MFDPDRVRGRRCIGHSKALRRDRPDADPAAGDLRWCCWLSHLAFFCSRTLAAPELLFPLSSGVAGRYASILTTNARRSPLLTLSHSSAQAQGSQHRCVAQRCWRGCTAAGTSKPHSCAPTSPPPVQLLRAGRHSSPGLRLAAPVNAAQGERWEALGLLIGFAS